MEKQNLCSVIIYYNIYKMEILFELLMRKQTGELTNNITFFLNYSFLTLIFNYRLFLNISSHDLTCT